MITVLQQRERTNLAETLSRQLNATYMRTGRAHACRGADQRSISTPSGKLAVVRDEDTFEVAPWNAALEPMHGRAVMGTIGAQRVTSTFDRGRGLPGRGSFREFAPQRSPMWARWFLVRLEASAARAALRGAFAPIKNGRACFLIGRARFGAGRRSFPHPAGANGYSDSSPIRNSSPVWVAPLPGPVVRARATLSLRGRRGPRSRAAVPASRPFGVRSLPQGPAIPAM